MGLREGDGFHGELRRYCFCGTERDEGDAADDGGHGSGQM